MSTTGNKSQGEALMCLVCEDDPLIRMNTVEMLEELGHKAIGAQDATTALAILAENTVDVLLTDVSLPDLSGIALAQRAKSQNPALPIIFATGYSHVGIAADPTVRLLPKPFTIESLALALGAIAK